MDGPNLTPQYDGNNIYFEPSPYKVAPTTVVKMRKPRRSTLTERRLVSLLNQFMPGWQEKYKEMYEDKE